MPVELMQSCARVLGPALRRLRTLALPEDEDAARRARLGQACAVLEDARAVVADGWLQNRWYTTVDGGASTGDPPEITSACVVGAVVHATRAHDPTAGLMEAGLALDVLWDALQESRGLGGPGVAGRAVPAEIRRTRMRELTRWNDRPGRTREDVLDLLDLAVTRAIMAAMHPVAAA